MTEYKDIWQYLANTDRPVLVYGMGDGAEKMLGAMKRFGIDCAGVFASDGFVRGQVFCGMTVMSFSDAIQKFTDPIALLAFGSRRPDVIEYIRGVGESCELYAPELPVVGETLFTAEWYDKHKKEHDEARSLLCDDLSRRVFDDIIRYRMTGDISILLESHMDTPEADALRMISADRSRHYLDLGAYTGDTVKQLYDLGAPLETVTALEPEHHSHKKLLSYLTELSDTGIRCRALNMCASDKCGTVEFSAGRGRGSRTGGTKTVTVETASPDSLYSGELVLPDYIKYDVEGAEHAAIIGSKAIIGSAHPSLNIALYHRPEDIFDIPLLVNSLYGGYRFYIRRHGGLPGWDLNLYCVQM